MKLFLGVLLFLLLIKLRLPLTSTFDIDLRTLRENCFIIATLSLFGFFITVLIKAESEHHHFHSHDSSKTQNIVVNTGK
uniref:p9 protein n=1 Tax=Hibiscus chlorotic ringspot virus TaxID=53181 RepID=R9UM97_9TOMB|nr:P9 protein [Hibiscus chlorotic ringspot virus]